MDYQKQANDFAKELKLDLKCRYLGHTKHFEEDEQERAVFECTLKNDRHSYTFKFGQSINDSYSIGTGVNGQKKVSIFAVPFRIEDHFKQALTEDVSFWTHGKEYFVRLAKVAPTMYDILSSLQKYEVGSHANFCDDFGYDVDSISTQKVYFKVQEEYENVCKLFTADELEMLSEIQ